MLDLVYTVNSSNKLYLYVSCYHLEQVQVVATVRDCLNPLSNLLTDRNSELDDNVMKKCHMKSMLCSEFNILLRLLHFRKYIYIDWEAEICSF